jgi:hypothetical protein
LTSTRLLTLTTACPNRPSHTFIPREPSIVSPHCPALVLGRHGHMKPYEMHRRVCMDTYICPTPFQSNTDLDEHPPNTQNHLPVLTMGHSTTKAQRTASIDGDLAAIEPPGRWYTKPHLLKLNFCILSLVLFCRWPPFATSFALAVLRTLTDEITHLLQLLPTVSMDR